MIDLWQFLPIIIFLFSLATVRASAMFPIVEPFIRKNALPEPKASAANICALAIGPSAGCNFPNPLNSSVVSKSIIFCPARSLNLGKTPSPLACPGICKGIVGFFKEFSRASKIGVSMLFKSFALAFSAKVRLLKKSALCCFKTVVICDAMCPL